MRSSLGADWGLEQRKRVYFAVGMTEFGRKLKKERERFRFIAWNGPTLARMTIQITSLTKQPYLSESGLIQRDNASGGRLVMPGYQ